LDIIVSSFGGVGTSPFLSWLSPKISVNCPRDSDGLKHVTEPSRIDNLPKKFVFIHGDPVEALISLYARKYIRPQFKKLTGSDNKATLEEYAESGEDLLGYGRQLDNWLKFEERNVLFLKYPHFWEHEQSILDFLELPSSTKLFQKKERTSRKSDVPKDVIDKLEKTYIPLNQRLETLGNFYIKHKG
jgi:hypothetical protein